MPAYRITFPLLLALSVLGLATPIASGQIARPQRISRDPQDWPMYNHDSEGTRWNTGERVLSATNVGSLTEKWRYPTTGDVYGTPAVVDNTIYFGDTSGTFYAMTDKGSVLWTSKVQAPITDSALVTNAMVFFGDQAGNIYGLDRSTGTQVWQVHPNISGGSIIWASAAWIEDDLGPGIVIGIGSNEPLASSFPGFSGSVVRLDPNTGKVVWQTYVIPEAEQMAGSCGAGVWSTPTYDAETGYVYAATGNSYAVTVPPKPASSRSDAIIALDAKNGDIKWTYQAESGDTGQLDGDFADSPHIYTLHGRKMVGAGEKTGNYIVLDAKYGTLIRKLRVVPECPGQNGLFATSAVAHVQTGNGQLPIVFAPGQNNCTPGNCANGSSPLPLSPSTGQITAIMPDASETLWDLVTPSENAMSGVAVANGVAYYAVVGCDGELLALDAKTGKPLMNRPTSNTGFGELIRWGVSGPSVSHGQVYVGTGTEFALPGSGVFTGPPSIVALGLPEN
ncbi:MAG: PQQ-binding-like beta-propeller repeat protein [Verrucomicrobia bacterium]|nr:PQQ-binding-like beta-propeller repeat protein [Verrucomicrobiota bacterium]